MPRVLLPGVLLVVLLASSSPAAPEPLPSQQQVRDAYAAGDYPKTLQMLSRLLALKGKAAEPYDTHELLRIRGETQLRMKNPSAASQAFGEASKIAPDGPSAAQDIATELLVKRAGASLAYQPKLKDPSDKTKSLPPVPILETEDRAKAIKLLYEDELAVVKPKIEAIKKGRTLPPILNALPAVRTVRWLEMAATGSDGAVRAMVADLVETSQKLMTDALKDMQESTESVERGAMEVITARVPVNDPQTGKIIRFDTKYRHRGPDPRGFAALRNTVDTCVKIHASCDEMGGTLGTTGKEFDAIKVQAEQIGTQANKLAKHNWRTTYDTPPPGPK